jgi:hypothetical protein
VEQRHVPPFDQFLAQQKLDSSTINGYERHD